MISHLKNVSPPEIKHCFFEFMHTMEHRYLPTTLPILVVFTWNPVSFIAYAVMPPFSTF